MPNDSQQISVYWSFPPRHLSSYDKQHRSLMQKRVFSRSKIQKEIPAIRVIQVISHFNWLISKHASCRHQQAFLLNHLLFIRLIRFIIYIPDVESASKPHFRMSISFDEKTDPNWSLGIWQMHKSENGPFRTLNGIYPCKSLNKLNMKCYSHPKSTTIDVFEQKIWLCHNPVNHLASCQ